MLIVLSITMIPMHNTAFATTTPTAVKGRILKPNETGDNVNWVEIAQYGNYSLIIRSNYLNWYTSKGYYGNATWQSIPYGPTTEYSTSNVTKKINAWFTGSGSAHGDLLPANAKLRNFTVESNALKALGTAGDENGKTNGFSYPTDKKRGTGNDVAFALSYSEAVNFISNRYYTWQKGDVQSSVIAKENYKNISIPLAAAAGSTNTSGAWLRSPGYTSYGVVTAGSLSNTAKVDGRAFQYSLVNSTAEKGFLYPALWVDSAIFGVKTYTVTYNANDGTGMAVNVTVNEGDSHTVVSQNFVKDGYTLTDYNTTTDSKGTAYTIGQSFCVSDNVTLYAQWTRVPSSLFSITDIAAIPNSKYLAIEVSAAKACLLDVKILSDVTESRAEGASWNSGSVLESIRTPIDEYVESGLIEVAVSSLLPDYFVVEAIIVDNDGKNLCDPFVFINYTKGFEQFLDITVNDFDGLTVISYTNELDNNFIVLRDDVLNIIDGKDGYNNLDSSRAKEHIYVFENADKILKTLKKGDKLVISHRNGYEVFLAEVISISESSGTVTVNANEDYTLDQFIVFMKIDKHDNIPEMRLDMSEADDFVQWVENDEDLYSIEFENIMDEDPDIEESTNLGSESKSFAASRYTEKAPMSELVDGDWTLTNSGGFNFGPTYIGDDTTNRIRLEGSFKINTTANVRIYYNAYWDSDKGWFGWFGDYFYSKITFDVTTETFGNMALARKVADHKFLNKDVSTINIGQLSFPLTIPGLVVNVKLSLPLSVEISGGVTIKNNTTNQLGFVYSTDGGYQPINIQDSTTATNLFGKVQVRFGPKIDLGLGLYLDALEASLYVYGGIVANAMTETSSSEEQVRHDCSLCVRGSADFFVRPGFKLNTKLGVVTASLIDHVFEEWKWSIDTISPFYLSIINSSDSIFQGELKMGKGTCPNQSYQTVLVPLDDQCRQLNNAVITVKNSTGVTVATGTGRFTTYLHNGDYTASAFSPGLTFHEKRFTVDKNYQLLTIEAGMGITGTLRGMVRDAETRAAIPNATARIFTMSGTQVKLVNVDSSGSFYITLPESSYRVVISAPNYQDFMSFEMVQGGRETFLETYLMVTTSNGNGTAIGTIKDSVNGNAISGVSLVAYEGWNNDSVGQSVGSYTTNGSGKYSITLRCGNYTLVATKEGYITNNINIVITGNPNVNIKNATLSPIVDDSVYRVVLGWGESPHDLDSHLRSKNTHVYFASKNSTYAQLDYDITKSFGPETTTITNLAAIGGFTYMVHDYTNRVSSSSSEMSYSTAIVSIYKGSELIRVYHVPEGISGTVWNVFSISADGTITDLNTFEYQISSSQVGNSFSGNSLGLFSIDYDDKLKDYERLPIDAAPTINVG